MMKRYFCPAESERAMAAVLCVGVESSDPA
jgi:hypothetical protein